MRAIRPIRFTAAILSVLTGVFPCLAASKSPNTLFNPPIRPPVPHVHQSDRVKNPIDSFILARLEKAGLQLNPRADRRTLLRRVTYDLTGLLPTPAEQEAFLTDYAPGAYQRVVDRLLQSPHFGERWAQHWLDVVRYAETEGFKLDRLRPDAFRYRDYVIDAFNTDMSYNRFLRQQLAGDELEPKNPKALVATGFYRLHAEESNGSNYVQIRQDILNDITDVTGSTFLGLTLGCARCHNHKFDPISQKDYYRFQAFFTPLIQRDDLTLVSAAEKTEHDRRQAALEATTRSLHKELNALLEPIRKQVYKEYEVVFDPDTQAALKTPAEKRTPLQRQLVCLASKQIERGYQRCYRRLQSDQRARYDELQKKLAELETSKLNPLPMAMAVTDTGCEAPTTFRLGRGNYLDPREEVQPGFPKVLESKSPEIHPIEGQSPSTGRRTALALWLCQKNNPLTSRVIVNRLWEHYFGQGIVATPNDFGAAGGNPSHPLLLDYLAEELVDKGWHLKAIHRLIVTSATYCQSSIIENNPTIAKAKQVDPDDALLWHARVRRRDGESIRDAVLQTSGQLDERMAGPSAKPELPEELNNSRYAWPADERAGDRNRRSIYVFAKRNLAYPLFGAFDLPDRVNACPVRSVTSTAPQALVMLNGEFTMQQARRMSSWLLSSTHADEHKLILLAFHSMFGRDPDKKEVALAQGFLDEQCRLATKNGVPSSRTLPDPLPAHVDVPFAAAVVDFCHALLNTAEFLYVE